MSHNFLTSSWDVWGETHAARWTHYFAAHMQQINGLGRVVGVPRDRGRDAKVTVMYHVLSDVGVVVTAGHPW